MGRRNRTDIVLYFLLISLHWNYVKNFSNIFLPSKAGVPIAVGIMSPDARIASNLDIRTDNL